ncbi:MAG: hypothetical protein ACK4MV_02230 [Beijerinckiaceae bacterium]
MIGKGCVSLIVLMAASTPLAAQTGPKAAYDELCLSCHKQPQRLAARIKKTDDERARLDAFLVKHYAPDADKRAAVLDYMFSLK